MVLTARPLRATWKPYPPHVSDALGFRAPYGGPDFYDPGSVFPDATAVSNRLMIYAEEVPPETSTDHTGSAPLVAVPSGAGHFLTGKYHDISKPSTHSCFLQ